MDISAALDRLAGHKNAVLITLRRDGRAQSSDIVYVVDGEAIKISATDDRAKTRNLRRDNRAVLHFTDPASWSYLSIDAIAEVSPVAAASDDATVDALVGLYRAIAGEHDDWDAYRAAMVDDGRCIVTLHPQSVTGQLN
ncbi:MAG: PPOX class F420-dependent oxidoreductase [Acidimicrobiales bacterium]